MTDGIILTQRLQVPNSDADSVEKDTVTRYRHNYAPFRLLSANLPTKRPKSRRMKTDFSQILGEGMQYDNKNEH